MNKTNTTKVNISLIQTKAFSTKDENLEHTIEKIKKAKEKNANIICLEELFLTKYFCQTENYDSFSFAESIPGPTTEKLSKVAKELKIVIIASLFEKRDQGLYHNTTVVIDVDGKIVGKYRKMHIPDDPGFYEKFYFTPGDLGFKAFDTFYGKIGVLICWDQWYPEAARLVALQGAKIIFYPTAIGWGSQEKDEVKKQQSGAWDTMHRSHSIANGVFVAAANRVGVEDNITFWGSSMIYDPFGNLLKRASEKDEEIIVSECDFSKIEAMRQGWPFLRDRRIDAYKDLQKRFLI